MSGWQPIATAPRDGTWLLLSGGDTGENDSVYDVGKDASRPVVARWEKSDRAYIKTDDGDEYPGGFWAYCFWDGDWRSGYDEPKLWMALPA